MKLKILTALVSSALSLCALAGWLKYKHYQIYHVGVEIEVIGYDFKPIKMRVVPLDHDPLD